MMTPPFLRLHVRTVGVRRPAERQVLDLTFGAIGHYSLRTGGVRCARCGGRASGLAAVQCAIETELLRASAASRRLRRSGLVGIVSLIQI
jgi:hypothetical protein